MICSTTDLVLLSFQQREQLISIYKDAFPLFEDLSSAFLHGSQLYFLLVNDRIVSVLSVLLRNNHYLLYNLCTDPKERRKGYARTLLKHVMMLYSPIQLNVEPDNIAAISLYSSLGLI